MKNISLEKSVRLVLKIGSSLLIKNNKFNKDWLETLIEDLIFFRKQKIEIIIVASGSVSLGKNYLTIRKELKKYDNTLEEKKELILLSKCDTVETNKIEEFKSELQKVTESKIIPISSHTKFGINKLRLSLVKICE